MEEESDEELIEGEPSLEKQEAMVQRLQKKFPAQEKKVKKRVGNGMQTFGGIALT